MIHRLVSANPNGTDFTRAVITACLSNGSDINGIEISKRWPDSPAVRMYFEEKSISEPEDTSSVLGKYGLAQEFMSLQKPVSAVEGTKSLMLNVPFRVKSPLEQSSPSGDFVREYGAVPVRAAVLDSIPPLELFKIANIVAFTKELLSVSAPNVEAVVRRILVNAASYILDKKFFDPSSIAISGTRPASITASGAATVSSTGSTAAAIRTDLGSMIAALTSWRSPVFVMRQSTLSALQARDSTLIVNGRLLGLPVFTSLGCPNSIILFDAGSIGIADGGVEIDASTEALLEMDDDPVAGNDSPITAISTLKSLWQNGMYGVRIIREVNWSRTLASGVVVMSCSY